MSRIDGLSVQGIRSFAPDHREAISLYTPLTLIVGYNGSGKTTIIECLKYATTGELPPNSKGGAFIHDPKLCNEKIVFANVGLKFTSVAGTQHNLHRRLQVTLNKAGTRSLKTLESSWKVDGEEKHTLSKKTSAVDEEVTSALGVSAAILDSVIFCHQDESLWPMSEPSSLKRKFDEIFEAQKYTKAIEQLKIVRKKQGDALRIAQVELKQQESDKLRATRNSREIQELTAELEALHEEVKELEAKIKAARKLSRAKREESNQFHSILLDLKNLQDQYKFRQDTVTELRDTIDMMPEGDAELNNMLNKSEARLDRLKGLVDEDTAAYYRLEQEVNGARDDLNGKLAEKGRLESDKEKHERQIQTRVDMVKQAAAKHSIRGFNHDLTDDDAHAFIGKIQSMLNVKKREHEKLQNELTRAADEAGVQISSLEGKKSSLTSERAFSKQSKTESERKIKRLQTEADSIDCDEGHINILEKNRLALEERLQDAQNGFSQGGWEGKIQDARNELSSLEKRNEDLTSELVNCTRLSSERAQLDLRKRELDERESNLDSLVGTHSGRISSLLKRKFDIDTLGSSYKAAVSDQTTIVREAKVKCDSLQKELDQRDFELAEARKRQTATQQTKSKNEQEVVKILKEVSHDPEEVAVEGFEQELEDLEADKSVAEKDLALFDHMKAYYNEADTTLKSKNKCQLCDRVFEDDRSKARLMKKILKGMSDEQKQTIQQEFSDASRRLARLATVRSQYDSLDRLKGELAALKKEIDQAQDKRDEKLRQLEAAADEHSKVAEVLAEIESVSKSVSEITQLHNLIQEAREQISRLHSQSQISGTGRSADEIQQAQTENSNRLKEAKKNLENVTRERQRNLDSITNFELEKSETKNKLTQAKQQMERKSFLWKDIQALREDNKKQDESVLRIDQELKILQPEIDAARGKRDAELERARSKAKLVAEERDTVAHTLDKLKLIGDDIQDYIDRGKASSLASVERAIRSLQEQHDRLKAEIAEVTTRINSQKEELAQGDRRKKNIADNLRYREHCRTLDKLDVKIKQLEDHNAEDDYNRLVAEAQEAEDEVSRVTARVNTIAGESGAKDDTLKAKLKEHETFYQGVEERYKETKIRVDTKKLAIEDLFTYGRAVDNAIMQFHTMKMEEVNRIAGELWRATYQGTDIDTIAIRSENDVTTSSSSTKRRNYNYRVTMVKQDTEMDMRGRCSAGQKVLASIIIRLALAESFGVNCGLIALDEPTTNLDSDNIRSLAVSLHGIIKARQAQANFQLIVITHDEEFLRHMRCNEFCDKFYRVKRDINQCSVIKKEDITMITE
ncbi:AAA domain-domain-containing protein [Coniella lustricola]|uniref:DNA repair protein RAD50 n=1 Tax=Coniella lustricola TaxID=2025994 RepID=A0A2T3AFE6_9PEZI|nr:AAA domain-domain-containing protein [Coniella lustricola]